MKKIAIILSIVLIPVFGFSQQNKWVNTPTTERAFVENKGQYDGRNWQSANQIKYTLNQQNGWFTFFSEKGVTHRMERLVRNPKKKKGEGDVHHNLPSRIHLSEFVNISFVGANSNAQIIAEEKTNHYYSYAVKDPKTKEVSNINNIKGYKKITYKNIYNNIDIEYTLHPDGGIKYNVILHPGANPNQIKMKYETYHTNHLDEKVDVNFNAQTGQLEINTAATKIIEHKPHTFYKNSKNVINSKYAFNNNILTFDLGNYDNTQTVVIDPWVVTPNFNAGDFTREVETDAAGNVYVIGGEIPMELRKYSIAGALIWTYITPWDTIGGDWLGTLATDAAGVSYITQGIGAEIERVNTAGAMVWHANNNGFGVEYWTITFNCDNTKLIVGGTKSGNPLILPMEFNATIYDIDPNNGSVTAQVNLDTTVFTFAFPPPTPVEVRSIAPTKNSKYVFLTHNEVGAINQNLTSCNSTPDFQVNHTHGFAYKCENYLSAAQNGGGLKAIIANDNFFYTHRGDRIYQWNINNGALVNNVPLPGGSSNNTLGRVVHCSGLDVDAAGNVYAGSMDRVVKFDQNLNILSQVNTTGGFTVYDVSVNTNGEVIAGGALLNNSTSTGRGGRIESLNMSAGAQFATVCCDPNFCPINALCTTDAPVNLNPNTAGGTWSSVPTTPGLNTTTGVFTPSLATPGNYIVTYTLGCGSFSDTIVVNLCTNLSVCLESNGDLTVSNGTPTYTWEQWNPPTTITITNASQCTSCGGTWTFGNCFNPFPVPLTSCNAPGFWSPLTTGSTITPLVGVDTLKVTDNFGNFVIINGISSLPPCSPTTCNATITPAGPFCVNSTAVVLTAANPGGTWTGTGITNGTTGAFDPAVAGAGNHTITYTLPTCNDTVIIVVNALDNAAFTYASGSFCLTDPNPLPTITGLAGGTFTINNGGTINPTTGEINITASGAGNYVVTYTTNGACPNTATFNVTLTSGANATITAAGPFCENDPAVVLTAANPGGTWTGTGITNGTTGVFDPAVAGANTHQIIYTISGSCGDADTISIVVNAQDNANFSFTPSTFCSTAPNPVPTISGTLGGTFTIDNSGVINAITGEINIAASGNGAFNVTYITNGTCPDTASFVITINNCTLPQPFANFTVSQQVICEGDCINFTDLSTSAAAGGITSWNWTFAGASTPNSIQQNPTNICYPTAGTYSIALIVTDANGVDDTTALNFITVSTCTTPKANFTASDTAFCAGNCINFTDLSNGATSWNWTFNGGNPSTSISQNPTNICFNTDGTFIIELIVANQFGSDTITQTITVFPTPIINAGSDVVIDLGDNTNLNATGSNGNVNWTPPTWLSCPTCPSTTSSPDETITYTVIVVDSNGCTASDQVTVFVEFDNVIWVPNIFSPNNDGNNDVLFVRGKGIASFNFFVYDRWGEKVFETKNLNEGWDGRYRGKDMNKAVFVYYLEATFIDGKRVTKKGDITLIR